MNFTIVPFLLGTQILINDTDWKYGPEFTFHANVQMAPNLDGTDEFIRVILNTKLKCRPKQPDSLLCRYEDTKIMKNTGTSLPQETGSTNTSFGFGNEIFEIKFNDKGIESYAFEKIDRSMGDYISNMYRLIANHLSAGTKVNGSRSFVNLEKSTVGECLVGYNISRTKMNNSVANNSKYKLNLLNGLEINEDVITIMKDRDLNECIPHPVYFFGTRHTYGVIPIDSIEKLKSSKFNMVLMNNNFISESVNVLDVYNENREKIGSVTDTVYLSLASVDSAEDDLKPIQNPMSMGLIVDKYHHECL